MKSSLLARALVLPILAALAVTAHATTVPIVIQGNNGPSGSQGTSGNLSVPAMCSISCYVQVTLSASGGGGGGAGVTRNGVTVISISAGSNQPGTYSNSNAVYNQPSATYTYSQGFGGPPYSVNGYVQTTFSW